MLTGRARERMVVAHVEARGITDPLVLAAMRAVPREAFVPPASEELAYEDRPLPIGHGQTISQPYVVAAMTAAVAVRPGARALEIGTGSGYGAAILAQIAAEVYTVERIRPLAEEARDRLAALGYANVHVKEGDGTLGWPEHAPYDAIVVTAGGPRVPAALLDQMAIGGRLVMPVGPASAQRLVRVVRTDEDDYAYDGLGPVSFVPLIGVDAWEADGWEGGDRIDGEAVRGR